MRIEPGPVLDCKADAQPPWHTARMIQNGKNIVYITNSVWAAVYRNVA